jgi:hypothetical protein
MGNAVVLRFDRSSLIDRGPIMQVVVGHPKIEFDEAVSIGLELRKPIVVRALIDTGAAITIINPELAQTFKLKFTGMGRINAAGHTADYPEYAAAISFPDSRLLPFDVLRIRACPLARAEMSCLIGRDILRFWELTYNGDSGVVAVRDLRR